MIHIRKVILLVVMFTLAFTMLLTTKIANAEDDISGILELEMREAVERGILLGYGDGKFGQDDDVTRGEFAAFMERALNLPASNGSFIDVRKDSKLAPSIYAVANAGIMIGGSDNTFNPDALITRAQVALTIKNALNYSEMVLESSRLDFTDANSMSSVTLSSVYNAIHYNIISGYPKVVNGVTTLSYKPELNATRAQAAAFIIRLLNAKESYVPPIVEPAPNPEPPPVDSTMYYNATIQFNQTTQKNILVKGQSIYTSYDAAKSAFLNNTNAKAIYKGNEVIQIKKGIAYAKHNTAGSATVIYGDTSLASSKQMTYIQYGRELVLLESTGQYVKVQAGGAIGYAKQSEIEYIPEELITNKDYYTPSSTGILTHYTYNHANNSFGFGGYQIGPKPSFMVNLEKYYSQDGVNFYNQNGSLVGKHYPYFQYLSARTKTNYTAEELNLFITDRLQTVSKKYATAPTTSKLIGLGAFLKEVESIYNVNALFILSAAMHESDSGMSKNAQTKNNLFGIKVYDSAPEEGLSYPKPEDSIVAFVTRYVNLNYGPPTGPYAKGLAPGNKTSGMNVHYASDPNWGSKIAQYMWRGDTLLGYKDSGVNAKQLAMTAHNGVINVRSTPEVKTDNLLFTYKAKNLGVNNSFGYPLVIVDETIGTDGYTWFKVLSDQNAPADFGWIREKDANYTLVKKIN